MKNFTFKEIFDGPKKRRNLSHIKNLYEIAESDGTLNPQEMEFISKIASNILSLEEFNRVLKRPESIDFYIPRNFDERVEQLFDLVKMMTIDYEVNDRELLKCQEIARDLGFLPGRVDQLINHALCIIAEGGDVLDFVDAIIKDHVSNNHL